MDKDKAHEVADALHKARIDYYFDENDEALQLADEEDDHLKVVRCIDHGISRCTHLLGIITEYTKDSWWVPYEIGNASGQKRECAHIIDEEVGSLPSYIQAATILPDRSALRQWLPKDTDRSPGRLPKGSQILMELNELRKTQVISSLEKPSFVPTARSLDEIEFTKGLAFSKSLDSTNRCVDKVPRAATV